jgi:hypothetical protein
MRVEIPHPGPQPALFEFPFAQAEAALDTIDELAAHLLRLADRHAESASAALASWRGATADAFERQLGCTLDALHRDVARLRRQAEQLEEDLGLARRRHDASLDARREWRRRHAAWEAAQQRP